MPLIDAPLEGGHLFEGAFIEKSPKKGGTSIRGQRLKEGGRLIEALRYKNKDTKSFT